MAALSPPRGRYVISTPIAGVQHHRYAEVAGLLEIGDHLVLKAEFDNPYDNNAIAVYALQRKIGYVPADRNLALAEQLRKGATLAGVLTLQSEQRVAMSVFLVKPEAPPLHSLPWAALGASNGDSQGLNRLAQFATGTSFVVRSNSSRNSASIQDPNRANDLAWFSKSPLPLGLASKINDGQVVAVRGKGSIYLYLKGTEPSPVPDANAHLAPAPQFVAKSEAPTPTPKENTMSLNNTISNTMTSTINFNKTAASAAGYLEAGRIANNKAGQLASKALPMMVRGYADTSVGKLVIANIAAMAAAQLRPQDATLQKLTMAMTTAAYQEVIQNIDIEGMLDGLLSSPDIQRAISKLPADDAAKA